MDLVKLDRLQAEQLARFVHEQHDRIEGGIAITDSRPSGRREIATVTGIDADGERTCEDRLFSRTADPRVEATLPHSALRHLREIADPDREPEVADYQVVSRRRYGRGYAVTISVSPESAKAMASRLRGLADVERDVRAYGDGADSSIERACDKAAERLEAVAR